MNRMVAIHAHRFGTSAHFFRSPLLLSDLPEAEEVAKALKIDYEPDREGEDLFFMDVPHDDTPVYDPNRPTPIQVEPIHTIPIDPEALRQKYDGGDFGRWGEHPEFTAAEWRDEVTNNDTRRGYWEWVGAQMEQAEDERKTE